MRSVMTLPAQPVSAHDARQFVHETLDKWHAQTDVGEAELVVSELVASASRSSGPNVTVAITSNATGIWIDVTDDDVNRGVSRLVAAQHAFETGRALTVVDSLAESWGVIPTDYGKHVWVHLADGRHLHEKALAQQIVTEYVHRVEHGDGDHGGTTVEEKITDAGNETLRRVVDELAHLATELVCLCSLYEDTDTVEFWSSQLQRMHQDPEH
jgi:hypothetical protein